MADAEQTGGGMMMHSEARSTKPSAATWPLWYRFLNFALRNWHPEPCTPPATTHAEKPRIAA